MHCDLPHWLITFRVCVTYVWFIKIRDILSWRTPSAEIQLDSPLSLLFLLIFLKSDEKSGLFGTIKSGNRLSTAYKRALFRANRRMVLLEPYSELKGLMMFAYFLSSPPPDSFCRGWISIRSRHSFSYSLVVTQQWSRVFVLFCVFNTWIIF